MRHVKPVGLALALASLLAVRVAAQEQPARRPPRGLFGTSSRTTLSGLISPYFGRDLSDRQTAIGDTRVQRVATGTHGGLTASLMYRRPVSRRFSFDAAGGTDVRYYTQTGALTGLTGYSSHGSVSIGGALGRRGSFRATQTLSASSFYQYNPLSGQAARTLEDFELPTSDYRVDRSRSYHYDVAATLDRRFGRSAVLAFDAGFRMTRLPVELVAFHAQRAGLRLTHQLGRDLTFNWGYSYEIGVSNDGSPAVDLHRLDIGPTFARTLALSRRTRVEASAGAALVSLRSPTRTRTVPRLVAAVSMRHELGRTWSVAAGYRAEPQIIELYRDPTYAHSAFAVVDGLVSRRVRLTGSAGVVRATLENGRGSLANLTTFGSFRIQVAAARTVAVFTEYALYRFEQGTRSSEIPFVIDANRQALRVGLSVWMPLVSAVQ